MINGMIYNQNWNTKTNNPHKNSLLTNANEVQQYDIIYENHVQVKFNNWKNKTLKYNLSTQNDEYIPYEHFLPQMKK